MNPLALYVAYVAVCMFLASLFAFFTVVIWRELRKRAQSADEPKPAPLHARCGKTTIMFASAMENAAEGERVVLSGPNGRFELVPIPEQESTESKKKGISTLAPGDGWCENCGLSLTKSGGCPVCLTGPPLSEDDYL